MTGNTTNPETEIAVEVVANPTLTIGNRDGKILLAFDRPSIGFVWTPEQGEQVARMIKAQLRKIRRQKRK